MKDIFNQHYQDNYWRDDESVSGHGSTMEATKVIRECLPELYEAFGINSVLDIPCGDFYWHSQIKGLENVQYIGADIVEPLIKENRLKYPLQDFRVLDITRDPLPKVDLVLVRDLFGHLSHRFIQMALKNLRRSGSTYLLATTFPDHPSGEDIATGEWRPVNLASLYGLGDLIAIINEQCTAGNGAFADKSLGLWKLDQE